MKPSWMVLLLVLLAGCGGTSRVVRLETGQGEPRVHHPRGGQEPVKLRSDEFEQSLADMARDVRPATKPLRHARALMFESWQEEVYLEWTGRRLVLVAPESSRLLPEQDEVTRGYGNWCESRRQSKDCLSLLKDTPTLDADGRYTLAMALAVDVVWDETKAALTGMADPEAVRASIFSAMAMYMMLWLLPEPVSKGLAAALTAGLIAYLGIDTVWGLIGGWVRLVGEVNRATTFEQLREAGARYGKVMGRHGARAFVLLATAAIGSTAGLGTKGPGLPGYSRAAVLAQSQGGFRWAAVGEVRSVAVSAEGVFTIALAPGALAMAAQNRGEGGSDSLRTRNIDDLLKPGGRLVGAEGSSSQVRILKGGLSEAQGLFEQLSAGGTRIAETTYPGTLFRLPGGGTIGLRPVSTSGPPTIDVRVPGIGIREIKFIP
jgi:hypothetical protein